MDCSFFVCYRCFIIILYVLVVQVDCDHLTTNFMEGIKNMIMISSAPRAQGTLVKETKKNCIEKHIFLQF